MKKFLFVDLDDTLFQTIGKCPPDEELHPVAYLKDGSACSFSTPRQRSFFDLADREMTLIPATARNHDAYRRVKLSFSSFAIINYGGMVLEPGGELDTAWLETVRADMHAALPGLETIMRHIDDYAPHAGCSGRSRLVEDCNTPFYALIKDPEGNAERLATIESGAVAPWIEQDGKDYFIHRNGNNLAILPKALNKARAVSYVTSRLRTEHRDILTFGMGDSRSDARFMAACDYAIVPKGTQLAALTVAAL